MRLKTRNVVGKIYRIGRSASKSTIHSVANIGKKHPILRYPLLIVLSVYLFLFNFFLNLYIQLKLKEQFSRAVAAVTSLLLIFTSVNLTALAIDSVLTENVEGTVVSRVIESYSELDSDILNQEIFIGDEEDRIVFPEKINVVVAETKAFEKKVVADENKDKPGKIIVVPDEIIDNKPENEETEKIQDKPEADGLDTENNLSDTESNGGSENDVNKSELENLDNVDNAEIVGGPESVDGAESMGDASNTDDAKTSEDVTEKGDNNPEEKEENLEDSEPQPVATSAVENVENVNSEKAEENNTEVTNSELNNVDNTNSDNEGEVSVENSDSDNASQDESLVQPEIEYVTSSVTVKVNVDWVLVAEESTSENFDSSVEGRFVYRAQILADDDYTLSDDFVAPVITVRVIEPDAIILKKTVGDVEVTLIAEKGVFPANAKLKVSLIENEEKIEKINSAVEDALIEKYDGAVSAKKTVSYDITVCDKRGNELQPVIPEGVNAEDVITVSFLKVSKVLGADEATNEIKAYHIDDQLENIEMIAVESNLDSTEIHPEHFSIYGFVLTDASPAVTLANRGYPSGKNMDSSKITLFIEVESGTANTFQWQSSSDKSTWTNMSGKTTKEISFTPTQSVWYRCLVNGKPSREVQTVMPGDDGRIWTLPQNAWYITNEYMAYTHSGTNFDVVGYYEKNNIKYMLQTSYGWGTADGWEIFSTSSAEPSASSSKSGNAQLDKMLISFNPDNDFYIEFIADLKAGQKAFAFGCDTQLGNGSTSGNYSDSAALKATIKDQKLVQVAMIGAASEEAAADDDPAFVIAPTIGNPMFWLGGYSSRQSYAYNKITGYEYENDTVNGETGVVTYVKGKDSGMTMSWINVPDGGQVGFRFSVGSVASTGAKAATVKVTSTAVTVSDADPEFYYAVYDKAGNEIVTWTRDEDGDGEIVFDNLAPNTEYVIKAITKEQLESGDTSETADTSAITAIDPLNPPVTDGDEGADPPEPAETIPHGNSIEFKNLNITIDYEYRLLDEGGNPVTTFKKPSTDGSMSFTGLAPGKTYYLVAKSQSTNNDNSERIEIKTLCEVSFNTLGKGTAPAKITEVDYDTTIDPPTAPIERGYAFGGWYKESSLVNAWDFEQDVVTANTTLYAKWIPHAHNWVYVKTEGKDNELQAFCSSNDTDIPCDYYGTSLENANSKVKVLLITENATYIALPYAGEHLLDELSGVDAVNNVVSEIKYYIDAACTTPTNAENAGAASSNAKPVKAGWYYAKVTINGQNSQSVELNTAFKIDIKTLQNVNLNIEPVYIATGSDILPVYSVKLGDEILTKDVDYEVVDTSDVSAVLPGTYTLQIKGINSCTGTATKSWKIVDANPPTVNIAVSGMAQYESLLAPADISYNSYFNSARTIEINATDVETENPADLKLGYIVSTAKYTESQIKAFGASRWTDIANGGSFTVADDNSYVVYVKVEDQSGNISYASTQGFIIDKIAPTIVGIRTNDRYCCDTGFRVKDNSSGIDGVFVDDVNIYADGIADYTLIGAGTKHTVKVVDKAGNSVTVSNVEVGVEEMHRWKETGDVIPSTCTEAGETVYGCSVCSATKREPIEPLGHSYDHTDQNAWDIVWKWDAENQNYTGRAYLKCARGCNVYKDCGEGVVTKTITPAASEDDNDVIAYKLTIDYVDEQGVTHSGLTFTKRVIVEKALDKEEFGDENSSSINTLVTNIEKAEDVPDITVEGFDTSSAKEVLTDAEKANLLDVTNSIDTTIRMFMEIKNTVGGEAVEEKSSVIQAMEEKCDKVAVDDIVYFDISMFKRVIEEVKNDAGDVVNRTERTDRVDEYSKEIRIDIPVADLGFPAPPSGYEKNYIVTRTHDYSENKDGSAVQVDVIYDGPAVDGIVVIQSKLYCTFAIGYYDTRIVSSSDDDDNDGGDDEAIIPVVSGILAKILPTPGVVGTVANDADANKKPADEGVKAPDNTDKSTVSDNAKTDGADAGDTPKNESGTKTVKCIIHWFYLLLLAIFGVIEFLIARSKKSLMLPALAINVIIAAILCLIGQCYWEYIAAVIEIVLAALIVIFMKRRVKTKE